MMLPEPAGNKRLLAEPSRPCGSRLAAGHSLGNVTAATVTRCPVRAVAHQTPSPLGQPETTGFLLPRFSGTGNRAGSGKKNETNVEPFPPFPVGLVTTSIEGRLTCPSGKLFLPCASAVALRPVVTHWVNRPLAAPPSVPVPQPSPAAVWPRVRRSVRRATSPTASFTRTNVTDPTDRTCPAKACPARPRNPAQHMLQRGFRVYPTLKRIPNVQ